MAGPFPEEVVRVPMARQRWRDVTFLHWPYDPSVVAPLLPSGLELDIRDGTAWVSITPFAVEGARLGLLPPVPGLSSFGETNVRTYVVGPDGRDGLWFLDLDVGSALLAAGARLTLGVPYWRADQRVHRHGDTVRYTGHRHGRAGVGHRILVETGRPLDARPDALVHWLTGRWRAWTRTAAGLVSVPVMHEAWPLTDARVVELDQTLLVAAGLPPPADAPLSHASAGVYARLGFPRLPRCQVGRAPTS